MTYLLAKLTIYIFGVGLVVIIMLQGPSVDQGFYLVRYKIIPRIYAITFAMIMSWLVYSVSMAQDVKYFVTGFVWLFYIFALVFVLEVYRKKIWFDQENIYCQELAWQRKRIRFDMIRALKKGNNGFRIIGTDGETIYSSYFMSGASELFDLIQDSKIDKDQNI